jgi:hypothetical protein
MKKSIRINGLDCPLVMVSDDGAHWYYKYHIANCALGYIAGDLRFDGDNFHNVSIWRLIKTNPPEKPKKKKYRPYNDEELESVFDIGGKLISIAGDGACRPISYRDGFLYLVNRWVGRRELLDCFCHRGGRPCGVEVGDDNPYGVEVDNVI